MLYFNDFIKILDIIQDYRKALQDWQLGYPVHFEVLINNGEATEEDREYLREYNLLLEKSRSEVAQKLAPYINNPHEVLPYIERM
jgi:hypothetical protein